MSKSPVVISSKQQLDGILKSSKIVVADCERPPPWSCRWLRLFALSWRILYTKLPLRRFPG